MASIFTMIINGDIPSYRVYEDEHTFAFLDINPRSPGHTLVVPKAEVDYLFDLEPADYQALWDACKTVSAALKDATGCERIFIAVAGYEVPHAHVHLIPTNELADFPFPPVDETAQADLEGMASRIQAVVSGYDEQTALVVVDVQNDFAHPDGSLSVAGGDAVIPYINDQIAAAKAAGATIVYTQDWHPESTPHFAKDGGIWPVHCVGDTWGSAFHDALDVDEEAIFTRKGVTGGDGYSAFTIRDPETGETSETGLDEELRSRGVSRVVIAGLATDYCVKESALDGLARGFTVKVLQAGIAAVDLEDGDGLRALEAMAGAGAELG